MKKILFVCLCVVCFLSEAAAQRYRVKSISAESFEVTRVLEAHPEDRRVVERYKAAVDSVMRPVLGQSRVAMSAGRPESLLGNWAADVLVEGSTCKGGPRADFGLINVGGLRHAMPEGVVRRGDVFQIFPFESTLVMLEMKGAAVLELMHNIAAVRGEGVSREVCMEINAGGELLSARIGGKPIDKSRVYLVATLDYLAEGNDRMPALRKYRRKHETGRKVRDVMMESIVKNRIIDSKIEGRIRFKE